MTKANGLYEKYSVFRLDEREKPNAEYFVLDLANDPGAVPAIQAYIVWCIDNGYHQLATDLEATLERLDKADW